MSFNYKKLLQKRELLICYIIRRDKNKFIKLYNLLSEIIYLFENYKIAYWAIKGTLLGCIRNKSIIPWDDNINLCIFEKDIHKLYSKEFIKSINMLELNQISENNEIILHKINSRYFVKIMWINEKNTNFTLKEESFGPLNIFIRSDYKECLTNYYGNKLSYNFGIITRSNCSGLLQKYINILKHYKVNFVIENKFLKYNPYNNYEKINNIENINIENISFDNLNVNSLDLDNLSVNSLDLDNLSVNGLNLSIDNYNNNIIEKNHNFKVVLYKLNNSIDLVEVKIIYVNL